MYRFGNRKFRNAPNDMLSDSGGELGNLGEHLGEWVELGFVPSWEVTLVTSAMPDEPDGDPFDQLVLPMHMPALDLDCEHMYWESSTPGHGALLINVPMDWDDYLRLIDLLEELGIIQPGFAEATRQRGYSALRTPWTKKLPKPDDSA